MGSIHEDDTVQDVLSIKAQLEENLNQLQDEKENIKKKLYSIREQKEIIRSKNAEDLGKLYKLKLELAGANKRLEDEGKNVLGINQTVAKIEENINDQMRLTQFESKIVDIQVSLEGAINYYSEDSLQMELMKRTNNVREQRVAYTKAESDYNDLLKRIEDQKREKERFKVAQLEKDRLEGERRKQEEEQKVMAEEARRREEFIRSKSTLVSDLAQQPFLGQIQPPTPAIIPDKPVESTDIHSTTEFETNGMDDSKSKSYNIPNSSLSQLLRW